MWRMTKFHRTFIASSLLGLLLVSGCSEQQQPQSPLGALRGNSSQGATTLGKKNSGPASPTTSTDTQIERNSALNMAAMSLEEFSVAQMVPASTGGTLYLGEFKFYIPPGALDHDTVITITQTSDRYIEMDFGPDGTQFDPPATMTVSYATANLRNLKPANLSISWFNTATNQWVNIGGTVNQSTMTVSASISHFTQYSLSTR